MFKAFRWAFEATPSCWLRESFLNVVITTSAAVSLGKPGPLPGGRWGQAGSAASDHPLSPAAVKCFPFSRPVGTQLICYQNGLLRDVS